jgi:hypothetical protein
MWKRRQTLEDAERARIARIVRNSEAGWLLYPGTGAPAAISERQAERIEHDLLRQLDRFIIAGKRMERRVFLVAMACGGWLICVQAIAPRYSGLALGLMTPFLLAYTLWEGTLDLRFRLGRRRWLRAQVDRLSRGDAIPPEIARHHRRYNLFQLISYALTLAGVGRVLWRYFAGVDLTVAVDVPAVALVTAGCLFYLPAQKVDATHRRQRWLGNAESRAP